MNTEKRPGRTPMDPDPRSRESPHFGCPVQYVIRKWNCENCGRSNATEVALDGTVKCDSCARAAKIQPSRARGGETRDQLAAFIHADAATRQGEWARTENAGRGAFRHGARATDD